MNQPASESASLLMCPPDYYAVRYEINPWMSVNRQVIQDVATRQWLELYRVLTEIVGVSVALVDPVDALPDLVFTANAGLVWDNLFIVSNFRYKERAGEAPVFRSWFAEKGFEVASLPADCPFEGEGDILPCGENLFAGYLFRSDIRSHLRVGEIVGRRVLSLELVDPYFYHLDTCFFPLNGQRAAYYPDAFDSYGERVLREHIPELIPVSREDARRFGCNSIAIGQQVVMNAGCAQLARELEERGYNVHQVDLSEFIKAGGSAKCLTLFLSRR